MFKIFFEGFFLQASLILAVGAQNIYVLNSGLQKQRHLLVALVSSLCDTLLILIGALGVATFFVQFPIMKLMLGIVGVAFLLFYGLLKLNESRHGMSMTVSQTQFISFKQTVLTSLGFSLLNPHVYLDTIVLIGGYSSKFLVVTERIAFGVGASVFSTLWFFGLAILASKVSRVLKDSQTMRVISLLSGIILILLSIKLGKDVVMWMREL
jgi:L-lysine exporter family protein LysE/ArgO